MGEDLMIKSLCVSIAFGDRAIHFLDETIFRVSTGDFDDGKKKISFDDRRSPRTQIQARFSVVSVFLFPIHFSITSFRISHQLFPLVNIGSREGTSRVDIHGDVIVR